MANIADTIKKQTDRILRQRQLNINANIAIQGNPSGDPSVSRPLDQAAHDALDHTGLTGCGSVVLSGSSAPTSATVGTLGQFCVETTTPKLYYCSEVGEVTYTWTEVGGSYTLPQATESALGGIKAKEKTTETAEVAIDAATGKLYVPAAGEAANGIPAGGTTGQVLAKATDDDYDAEWIDAPSGGGGTPSGDGTEDTIPDALAESSSSFTASISFIEILASFWVASVKYYIGSAAGNVTVNLRNAGGQLLATKTIASTGSAWNTFTFDDPVYLTAKDYIVVEVLLSSQKLNRKTSTLYSGTLWKMKSHRVNDFFTGATYSETPGLGLMEYDDTP